MVSTLVLSLVLMELEQERKFDLGRYVHQTLADSYVASYHSTGDPAKLVLTGKSTNILRYKYSGYPNLQSVAFEAVGGVISYGAFFFRDLRRRFSSSSNDRRATVFQHLSVTFQRFNAVAFCASFSSTQDLCYSGHSSSICRLGF